MERYCENVVEGRDGKAEKKSNDPVHKHPFLKRMLN